MEEMNLVRDLAVILISAGAVTILSRIFKQPLILGYIIAGFLVGPHITFFPSITNEESVKQWSEIGIIFLMFGLGLEFSFKKLLKVGASALSTAGVKFIGVFILGYVAGFAMHWTPMESIFLAGLLSMSSTTVVIKSYDEMKLKNKPWAGMVFGTLVVEDLIAIILMVLFSTIAVSNKFDGGQMIFNIAKLVFFILLWFLIGLYAIPLILKKVKTYINDEILLIVSLGLCLGMVVVAESVGFSSALGAFVMGSILAETTENEKIIKLVEPIKNLFGAIFFVSVGMMISPAAIAENWLTIIILTILVYIGHIFFAGAGIIVTGGGLKNAVNTGFSLAQLGEFGFILAGVGISLGVMRDFIYPVIIAVSVITTFTTPYMIKFADPVYRLLEKKLPASLLNRLEPEDTNHKASKAEKSEWKALLQIFFLRILIYGVILIAIILCSKSYLQPFTAKMLSHLAPNLINLIVTGTTLLVMLPFIYGMAITTGKMRQIEAALYKKNKANTLPLIGLMLLRIFLALECIVIVITNNFDLKGWSLILVIIAGLLFLLFARLGIKRNNKLESQFMSNLNAKEELEKKKAPISNKVKESLNGYDVHTEPIILSPDSTYAGKPIREIPFRETGGANIIKIQRGSHNIIIPSANEILYPGDRIIAVGSTEQLSIFKKLIMDSIVVAKETDMSKFKVECMEITPGSHFDGRVLKDSRMRNYQLTIISLLRNGELITNPKPDTKLGPGDYIWLAGNADSIEWVKNN